MKHEELTLNGPALRWMITESTEAGLFLAPASEEWGKVHGKLGHMKRRSISPWVILEILPEIWLHNSYHFKSETRKWFKSFL